MKVKITEEELIKRCLKADPLAQRYLYEKYAAKFLGICKRYFVNIHDAEDVLVMAFAKIFEKIKHYRGEGSFEGWMKRLLINECLTTLRKKQILFVEADAHVQLADNTETAEQMLNTEDLLACLQRLPDGYRTVFNLYAIEGYSHQEIANMLNISEGTSKSQLSRARNLLQNYLKEMTKEASFRLNEVSQWKNIK
ncbi:MAG: sigma-70 family RNA polymerase sigma factor [Thermonemataceae bacterium]|nr:sigma-70 family RNA polymerase sigma factor [Thermonemataceae bacterium]